MRKEQKQKIPLCRAVMFVLFLTGALSACNIQNYKVNAKGIDFSPPVLLEIQTRKGPEVELLFNEKVQHKGESCILESGEEILISGEEGNKIIISPEEELSPGKLYKAALTVEDPKGNSCHFILPFRGWNPNVPSLLINELNPKGSKNSPDCIELYASTGGNCAGMALFYGSARFHKYRYIFPPLELKKGDYIIIHCRREFLDNEKDESSQKDECKGKLCSDEAWDLWLTEDQGLSGSNGVLSLYNCPEGEMLDAVIYTNRSSKPDENHLGWTGQTFDQVSQVNSEKQWLFSSDLIPPEEAVSSKQTTATRSLCRNSLSEDSNTAADWHTVPTGKKSFGKANSDEVYEP